jgi:hypothetical protein
MTYDDLIAELDGLISEGPKVITSVRSSYIGREDSGPSELKLYVDYKFKVLGWVKRNGSWDYESFNRATECLQRCRATVTGMASMISCLKELKVDLSK